MASQKKRVKLRVIRPPRVGPVVAAPPTLKASDHTVEYVCGHCEAALLHAEEDQVSNLVIQCRGCGYYNQTEG
jgi:DNA-directed RNA polymerase subunit RPC12/RpoP